jgi:hypothetical protein
MLAQPESGTNVLDFESADTADGAFCRLRNNLDFRTVIAQPQQITFPPLRDHTAAVAISSNNSEFRLNFIASLLHLLIALHC